ncbi:MAG: hypothetical protein IJ575_07345 [Selenomonadaceae bacterium]|nr:hypothetical protein [Selenomonadaceae bacterium]
MSILESFLENPVNRLEDIESNFGKITGNIDQAVKAKWLEKALVRDGRYIIQPEYYKGLDENPNLHPVYYVLNADFTKTRIGLEVAYELYKTGKVGWEISRDSYVALHSKKTR